jgi:hypothetical protein
MSESKGHGVKGRGYDELSGIGTSSAGPTGTVGNLNTRRRDGGVGEPPLGDSGNKQSVDHGQSGELPALGSVARANASNLQREQGSSSDSQGGAAGGKQGGQSG